MTTVNVTLKQLPKALRGLEREVLKTVKKAARAAAMHGQQHMISKTPVDTGELKESWMMRGGSGKTMAQVVNTAPHAGIVEEGARPHPVSLEGRIALEGWVRRHFPEMDAEEQIRFAENIANKLAAQGQEPTYFVRNELEKLSRLARDEMARMLSKVKPPKGGG